MYAVDMLCCNINRIITSFDTSNILPDSFHVVQIIVLGVDARLDREGHDD